MTTYTPPVRDISFVLKELLTIHELDQPAGYEMVDEALVDSVVNEAGRFCAEVIAPLNALGDQQGCTRHPDGSVTTPDGFKEAYQAWVESGWGTLPMPEEYGGQGMPHALFAVIEEYLNSSSSGFTMYLGIMPGAVATVESAASEELKNAYLPKMVSGEWLATMALTEGHAGTDLGLLKTRAVPKGDGSYAISGEKIFASGGEQDLTDNIVHLVLARTPDAPSGTRGISLFLVPKVLPDSGQTNAVSCGSIEHKMGLHGSATCVLNFDKATGWLVGEENAGLMAMFIMMNAARLAVGVQGLAHAEHAYQRASAYALERRQGRGSGDARDPSQAADPLIVHPDIRRLLMDARAFIEGFRALVLWTAVQIDISHGAADKQERREAEALVSFLTPVLKAYGSDNGFATAVAMQQVFGGHGYVNEWGVEQIVRDSRICMIYEGANGVQALDLAGRKLVKDGGAVAARFFDMVEKDCSEAPDWIARPLSDALEDARKAAEWLIANAATDADNIGAGSYAFLELIGVLSVGWMWARMVNIVVSRHDDFAEAKRISARHFAERTLPQTATLRRRVEAGASNLMALEAEAFLRTP